MKTETHLKQGGEPQETGWKNTVLESFVHSLIVKMKSRLLPEQSKVVVWKCGNLELEINLNAASSSAGSGGGDSLNVDHTLKFYNSIKLSQNVYKKQYYPKH